MPRVADKYPAARGDDTRWPGTRTLAYEDPTGAIQAGQQIGGLFDGIPFFDELGNLIPAPITSFLLSLIDDIPVIGDLLHIILGIGDGSGLDPTALLSSFFDALRMFLPFLPDLGDGSTNIVEAAANFITGIINPANILAFFSSGLIPGLDASKITSGFFPMDIVTDLPNTFLSIGAGIFNAVFGAGSSTATTPSQAAAEAAAAAVNLNGRVTALEGGGVMTTYTVSGTWTNPAPTAHRLVTVVTVGGGDGGARGGSASNDTAKGGRNGGWVSRQLYLDEIAATVAMTIGGAGIGASSQGSGGAGAGTSFGSYVSSTKGLGAIYKKDGSYSTAVAPGDGGDGCWFSSGTGADSVAPSSAGISSAFAAGGKAGFGSSSAAATGAAGGASPVGVPSGGGGGGGGSCSATNAGDGGAGGFPGGGGGGGGANVSTAVFKNGGNGAAGCIYIIDPGA